MLATVHRKIILLAVMALGALILGGAASMVSADPDPNCNKPNSNNDSALYHCVHTNATVGGGTGNPPQVLWAWVLPDMDYDASNGMDFTTDKAGNVNADGNDLTTQGGKWLHLHDDASAPRKYPGQVVVRPNIDDKPSKRLLEVFAVVTDPNGIDDILAVRAEVRYPDGSKKSSPFLLDRHETGGSNDCDAIASATDVHSPRHAAENTGQLPHHKALNFGAGDVPLLQACQKGLISVYSGTFLLNNDQPDGKYQVLVRGTDHKGSGPDRQVGVTVLNVIAFKIDFNTVTYGLITPGVRKVIGGDQNFGAGAATVQNTGNHDACLSVRFSAMEGKDRQDQITKFDASLWTGWPLKQEKLDLTAGNSRQFSSELEPKVSTQIDFAVKPPVPLDTDLYQGTVDLSIKKAPCA